ncbi:proline dehydrogenase family protein [Corynebacterium sp.]|uniref:proline dehydrogenase family protein n=1 Tax=Corynebacterium sp. TaxID=1720 RepID=UPI003B3A30F8
MTTANTAADKATPTTPATTDHLAPLADAAVAKVTAWLEASRTSKVKANPSAERLSAVLSDPNGLDFTVGFVDRVVRTEDQRAAGRALSELGAIMPDTLSALDKAQIRMGSALAPVLPQVVVPAARQRIRSMVGHMIVDARDKKFGKAVAELTAGGHRLNINLLGEAVLGEKEADHHLEETRRLLARTDVDYVSIKASSIASRISLWGFDETVDYIVERLTPLYLEAARAPKGSKFINLDMEEYRDLTLTIAVFRRLLSLPETKNLEAGIVLQAYLPDALGAIQELSAFADQRVSDGGAGIKVRLVKGANLAMETVHAEVADWPVTTCGSKQATDANYKLVLDWTMHPENMRGLRLGVAGHNLFDIAFAHLLSVERGVTDRVEFEMLQGMATEQADAVSSDVGQLLLYVPAVRPQEFDVAISYLVRRLEENAASANFMSGIFDLEPGNDIFRREEARFRSSLGDLSGILDTDGYTAPLPNHRQDRGAEVEPSSDELAASYTAAGDLPAFRNEPDTDPSLPANQRWAADAIATSTRDGWLEAQTAPTIVADDEVDALVTSTRDAAAEWASTPAAERAAILYRTADLLAARRGHLISIAAAEVGKAVSQADTEISEAIDFARYYAHYALELDEVSNARFTPDKVVLVTPPWNFPLAIPAGSTFAALAAGAAVIHKPSKPTPHCSMAILDALWDAGVPREVLRGVYPADRRAGRSLVSHPSVDRVILTGASETAAMFESWRPELKINAETSGKNGIIVTPAADRDLAVADMVYSAFGHAGQKCSAASLGILVGSVYSSERFRRQLVDAASSMIIDWPTNMRADMGPLTELPSDKLERALTTLEDGESWLLKPRQLDDTGRLWSPGIKDGVKPGSFFHLTEVFGPVLGLMKADDLDEAITLQNATDFGLTGGIQSLDPAEVRTWVERIEVGNAYVNRGITGAIVQRQSFGGWKQSSVGLGSKAGGPNYVMLMGGWSDDTSATGVVPTGSAPVDGYIAELQRTGALSDADAAWLAEAGRSDVEAWESEFGTPRDVTGLTAEANIFRYRPAHVVLRISADARPVEVARAVIAAHRTGSPVRVVVDPAVSSEVSDVLAASSRLGVGAQPVTADDDSFATRLSAGVLDDGVGARVRVIGTRNPETLEELADRPEVCLLNDEVTASGRVELRLWRKEQAVSMTLHRFGNPSTEFHALADEIRRG